MNEGSKVPGSMTGPELDLDAITEQVAHIIGAFGDDWKVVEDSVEEWGEVSVRTADSTPDHYTEVFRTSQLMGEYDRSPLAEFLLSCPVIVPALMAQVEGLRDELEAFKPQPMSQRCRDGHHNGAASLHQPTEGALDA